MVQARTSENVRQLRWLTLAFPVALATIGAFIAGPLLGDDGAGLLTAAVVGLALVGALPIVAVFELSTSVTATDDGQVRFAGGWRARRGPVQRPASRLTQVAKLQRRVWPAVVVSFEDGLNVHVLGPLDGLDSLVGELIAAGAPIQGAVHGRAHPYKV